MKLKLNGLGIVFMLISFVGNAQELELGKVSIKELEEKMHPKDTSAVASVLYSKGHTYFNYTESSGFVVVTEVETRIKIYKKEGYDWANKSIRYYIGATPNERVSFSKAVAYNLVDGKIEKTKLKSDGEFTEQVNKYWGLKKIAMPNVKEGTVIEYRYTIESPYITSFPDWEFQAGIPVNYSEYKTSTPEYFTYSSHFKGFVVPKVTKLKENKSITFTSKERSDGLVVKTSFSSEKVDYAVNVVKYVEENLPAMIDEDYVNNINNYKSIVVHELAMSKMPNGTAKHYSTDWESVVKTIYKNEDFGAELNKTNYFEEDINAVLAGMTNKNDKINAIFNFVKSRMNWNDYYGYSCDQGVKTAYKQKTGNTAEINLMLTAMLRHAGLAARPVLVSTRSNGISYFPNRTAYNYVIAAVEGDNKIILLDATDKFTQPNILPFRALNWMGKLIREDGSSVDIDLMPNMLSKEAITMNYKIEANGEISGKIRKQYTDYNAEVFRQRFVGQKEDAYLENLENKMNKIEISDYKRDNEKEMQLPVVETFSFSGSGLCDVVGDKMYFSPMIFFATDKNPFIQEKREYPVDFGFPFQDKYVISIDLPEGYAIESAPKPINVQTDTKLFGFSYNIVPTGNRIQLIFSMDMNTSIVSSENYEALKDVFQKLVAKQNEKIVLKKV
ncbi:hypothetical protein J2X31_000329 [Flavobacterium arsenatis]|uniref:Transglutaminase n=1 Tax=Flavobacterium arsenatis TaxID=1484332 RepID=A0ABU1TK79_9FLAO|nr:DUF3857 domain-containing protein [Flavobacterium arsenatis]MDR6966336.1 hypothetical protein [Flavobacterium arsenatis]